MKKLREKITYKSILGIVSLLILFSAIMAVIGYNGFTDSLLAQYADGAFRTADTAALALDGDRMQEYRDSGGEGETYRQAFDSMDRLCNSSGATFIYLIQPDLTDYGHITFLFSTINRESHYTQYDFGYYRETTNDDYRTKYRALYEGTSDRELVIRDKGYIETDPHITAMIPLKDSSGKTQGIICVQRQMDFLADARNKYLRNTLLVLAVLILLVVAGQSIYLRRVLLRPVEQIADETARFARDKTDTGKKLRDTVRNRDEIGKLADSVDRMEEQIRNYMQELTRITAEKERISTELALATRIQADMLPHVFPPFPDRKEFELYATMNPAREVGGDFYDFFLIDDDHLGLVIADVSGKGVPAALFMMASKIILQSCAMLGASTAEILTRTNEAVCSNNQEGMFVTVWLGILEISTGKLTAANSGHEYPILKHANGTYEVVKDKHGLAIGAMEGVKYREYELMMEPGSRIFLYTDGVPEATDKQNRMFGMQRMLDALNRDPGATPEQTLQNVQASVDAFVKEAEQFDDLTMLCLEYRGKGAENK